MFEGKEPPNQAGVLCVGLLGSASDQDGEPQLLVPVGNECLMLSGGGCQWVSKAGLRKQVWCLEGQLGWVLFWEV